MSNNAWNTHRLLQLFLAEFEEEPGLTITHYMFKMAGIGDCPLREREERAKFRQLVLNKELDEDGSLAAIASRIAIEEHPKHRGKPKTTPHWAQKSIAAGLIRSIDGLEPPTEPREEDLHVLVQYAKDAAKGTRYHQRIEMLAERITDHAILDLLASMATTISAQENVIRMNNLNSDLYERQITTIQEKHEQELKLLQYQPPSLRRQAA